MLNPEQRNKLFNSVRKVGPIELILAPHRISQKCIIEAKTDEAKSRLIQVAEAFMCEDMKRLHVRGYQYPSEDKKHNFKYEGFSIVSWLKNLWK